MKGNSTRIILEGTSDIVIEQALKFEFKAINNKEEYETLILGMILALKMGASKLKPNNDSQLLANQVFG